MEAKKDVSVAEKTQKDVAEKAAEEKTVAEKTAERIEEKAAESAAGADEAQELDDKGFAEQVKKIALAAADAVNVSPEDLKGFVTKLVEKGDLAQQDGKRIVQDLSERVRKAVSEPMTSAREAAEEAQGAFKSFADRLGKRGERDTLTERINASIERVLGAMHIASASQVEALRGQIDAIDGKLELILEKTGMKSAAE